ncbi:hypothetical protein AAFF_G00093070 [Aldrovandia affinis]|uniref:Secreted protein n=1 Tax=Aldrovandia affinis TaxID=143900 RepID=A0AAD7T2T1_9TELE|nr:hypothetical protein AAFF_G00093070 [Aldrovandia affinis]
MAEPQILLLAMRVLFPPCPWLASTWSPPTRLCWRYPRDQSPSRLPDPLWDLVVAYCPAGSLLVSPVLVP